MAKRALAIVTDAVEAFDLDAIMDKLGAPKRRNGNMSPEKAKVIEALWEKGYSVKQIAEGVGEQTFRINNYLIRTGAKTVNKRAPKEDE